MPKDRAGNEEELAQDRPTQAILLPQCTAAANCWVAFCCHPNLGWLGSGSATRSGGVSANSLHDGISRPAVTNDCSHARTASKHGAVPSAMWVIIVSAMWAIIISAMVGCRSFIRMQSAQLAQWAPPLERCALANPNPPTERDKVKITLARSGAAGVPNIVRMQVHTLSSWCSAKVSVRSGRTALSQKFALVDAHIRSHTA